MSRSSHFRALAILAGALSAPAAFANSIDFVNLGSSGGTTTFQVTGTYLPDTPITAFSSPNTPYLLTFTLPTTPTPDFTLPFGAFGIGADIFVNSVEFNHSQVIFFGVGAGGGMNICLDAACVDPNTICTPAGCVDSNPPAPNSWAIYGDPVYTGDDSNPTFIEAVGGINVVHPDSYVAIAATPEPSSLALLGTGMLGAVTTGFRRLRSRRSSSTAVVAP